MSPIISKKDMSEEDIKLNYITPALLSRGWKDKITMETKVQFTDGKVNIKGNLVYRDPAKKADWVILPVDSFNAYFGTTCFDRKWLPEFPESIIEREDYAGLCRYRMSICLSNENTQGAKPC